MNRILSFIVILFACSSCQVYHYNILRSSTSGLADEPFTFEKDSIAVSYSFDGGLIDLTIHNKSSKPLFVDWSKSAIIDNGISNSFWLDDPISGPSVEAIPPDASIINTRMQLPQILTGVHGPNALMFTERDSPLRFRGYITLSYKESFADPIVYDNRFWLGEVHEYREKITVKPKQNAYITTETTEAGKVAGGVAIVGLLVGSIAVSSHMAPTNQVGQ